MGLQENGDLTDVMWNDRQWLALFPLNEQSVLDYFSLSPFYDRSCNNEIVKMQRLDPGLMATMEGIEYAVLPSPPSLFLIAKNKRTISPRPQVQLVAIYYVTNGNIYQTPSAHAVLSSRVLQSLHHIRQSFDVMQKHAVPGPAPPSTDRHWVSSLSSSNTATAEQRRGHASVSDAGSLEKKAIDRILYDILDKNRRIAAAAASIAAKEEQAKSST